MWIIGEQAHQEYETQGGDMKHLEVAIHCRRLAIEMTEDNDSLEKADTLTNLAVSLHARYGSTGDFRGLQESLSSLQLANVLTPEQSPVKLRNLSTSLSLWFE